MCRLEQEKGRNCHYATNIWVTNTSLLVLIWPNHLACTRRRFSHCFTTVWSLYSHVDAFYLCVAHKKRILIHFSQLWILLETKSKHFGESWYIFTSCEGWQRKKVWVICCSTDRMDMFYCQTQFYSLKKIPNMRNNVLCVFKVMNCIPVHTWMVSILCVSEC